MATVPDGLPPDLAALVAQGVQVIPIADAGVTLLIQNHTGALPTEAPAVVVPPSSTPEEGA